MNDNEVKAEKPNTEANKKAEETKVTVNVNECGSSWLKPTLWVVGGIAVGALGALGVKWFLDRDDGAATVDTTADA